jgi:hypothetical protein
MVAIKWANDDIWLFLYSDKKRLAEKYLKVAQNWMLHQGNSSIKVIFMLGESKNIVAAAPGWQNLFTKITVPDNDSLRYIINSPTSLKKHIDTCIISSGNDTTWVKIARVETEIQFPITCYDSRISLQNHFTDNTRYISAPCVVSLKKNGFRIHIYKFPGN